jgi:hypothetical protein
VTGTALTEERLWEVLSEYLRILQRHRSAEEMINDNAARLFATPEEGLNR